MRWETATPLGFRSVMLERKRLCRRVLLFFLLTKCIGSVRRDGLWLALPV